jgi:uncharacterized delta-60 repeat protein
MKKLIYVLAIVLYFLSGSLIAQVTQEWVARYNGPGNDYDGAYSIAVDGSGNVYITGSSKGGGTNEDYATIKYNSAGVQQWVARYNGPGNQEDGANSLAVDGSGNVYVTGYSVGSGTDFDYATIKYNSAGVQQWVARYNGPGNSTDGASSLAVDGSGNVYITGTSTGSGTGRDYTTIKYNSVGVEQWVASYNGPGNDYDGASSIAVDGSGNVYITGSSKGSGTYYDYATIKYNIAGVQQWVARYNGPENSEDGASSLAVDGSGNVYVTGYSTGSGTNYDYATLKYNSAGVQLWVVRYNGPGNDEDKASSLAVDSSGNVYVTGDSFGSGTLFDYATIKYNTAGVEQWVARYNGPGNSFDMAFSIGVDGSGNVYVTGYSTGSGTSDDFASLKYNSAGVQLWTARYNGPGNKYDGACGLAIDGLGNVYVTGYCVVAGTNTDYATIKYSQTVGIQNISTETPSKYSLSQNYPNPFNPMCNVQFSMCNAGNVKLVVYDVQGREVQTLVNERLQSGTYEAKFDGSMLNSGVYFYKLITDGFTETKKMLMLK